MDWIKRNWLWLLLVPVGLFFAYRYFQKKVELSEKMKAVRSARTMNGVAHEEEVTQPNADDLSN